MRSPLRKRWAVVVNDITLRTYRFRWAAELWAEQTAQQSAMIPVRHRPEIEVVALSSD